MFSYLEENRISDIETVRSFIQIHRDAEVGKDASDRERIKVYTVSACVTRLYAIYESFVTTAISDYLDAISEIVPFSSLSGDFKNHYRIGISQLLNKVKDGIYESITHEDIVKWYYEAISGVAPYRFVTLALTKNDQNFRLNVLETLFNRISLTDLKSWLSKHPEILSLYPDEDAIYGKLELEVKDFIILRNDASHTILDSLEGEDNLERLCDLTRALIIAIAAFLRKELIVKLEQAGRMIQLGVVTEVFKGPGAFIAELENGVSLSVGDEFFVVSSTECVSRIVDSLMLNNEAVQEFTSNSAKFEAGIKCETLLKKNAKLYIEK